MNFLALVQRLHSELQRSTAAPTSVVGASDRNARLVNRIADAWTELQSERDWRWMRVTTDVALTVGQQTYTGLGLGASRFGRWRREDREYSPTLYVDGSANTTWELYFENLERFRQNWVYRTQANSTPIAWTIDEADQFLIGPAPALAYKLRAEYWMEPSTLTLDADTPDLPVRFHMILVWRALIDAAKADAKPEILALAETNFGNMHDKLLRDQARMPSL